MVFERYCRFALAQGPYPTRLMHAAVRQNEPLTRIAFDKNAHLYCRVECLPITALAVAQGSSKIGDNRELVEVGG